MALVLLASDGQAQQRPSSASPRPVAIVVVSFPERGSAVEGVLTLHLDTSAARVVAEPARLLPANGRRRLSLALQPSGALVAGDHVVGVAVLRYPSGNTDSCDVRLSVSRRRDLRLGSEASRAGGSLRIRTVVHNEGNAPDTVTLQLAASPTDGWSAEGAPQSFAVPPQDSVAAHWVVRPSGKAPTSRLLYVRVTTSAGSLPDHSIDVSSEAAGALSHAKVPVTVTLGGSPVAGAGSGVGVEGSGALGAGTSGEFVFRRSTSLLVPAALRGSLVGRTVRLGLRRGANALAAGDLMLGGDAAGLPRVSGRGADLTLGTSIGGLDVLLARPADVSGDVAPGRLAQGQAFVRLGTSTVGAFAADLEHALPWEASASGLNRLGLTISAAGRYGDLRLGGGQETATLPGWADSTKHAFVEGNYALRGASGSLNVSGRMSDAPVSVFGPGGRDLRVAGSLRLHPRLDLVGWSADDRLDYVGRAVAATTSVRSLALRSSRPGATVQAGASMREAAGQGVFIDGARQSIDVVSALRLPLGLDLQLSAEAGRIDRLDRAGRFQTARGAVARQLEHSAARLAFDYSDGEFGAGQAGVEASYERSGRRVDLLASASARVAPGRYVQTASAAATLHARPDLDLVAGLDFQPWRSGRDAWALSFGIRQRLMLPTPFSFETGHRGRVFLDLNGNGRNDPGEPGLAGVRVWTAAGVVVTDGNGEFRAAGSGLSLALDGSSLPPDLAPGDRVEHSGYTLPVVRGARLRVHAFADRNANGHRDPGEVGVDADVEVQGVAGPARRGHATAQGGMDAGIVSPGHYRLRAVGSAHWTEADVIAGAEAEAWVAVDAATPLRFGPVRED